MLNVFPAERPRTDDLDKGGKTRIHMILFHSFLFCFFTSTDEIPSELCPKFSHRFRACKIYDH